MCSRADVDGSIVRRNMGRPRRSTIASTAGVRREFGRASSRRRPNLLNRRNEWLSTARMSKRIAALAAEKGGVGTGDWHHKGGRNSKIHGLVDKLCRPWVLILTPGNTADCTVGTACVSLLDGIAELLGNKAYDSNSFRKSLRKDGIKPVIPGRSNRKKRTTSKPIRIATSSSAATAGSRTSGASQRATTNSLGTTSQPCASLPPWHSGFLRGRPIYAGGARSMVDHGLATPAAVPWSGADARHRRDNDSRRRAWAR